MSKEHKIIAGISICCEECNEIYLVTIDCPYCGESMLDETDFDFLNELDVDKVRCCKCNKKFKREGKEWDVENIITEI